LLSIRRLRKQPFVDSEIGGFMAIIFGRRSKAS
jgi:hypothetical protein